jgi:hypothetical protein
MVYVQDFKLNSLLCTTSFYMKCFIDSTAERLEANSVY